MPDPATASAASAVAAVSAAEKAAARLPPRGYRISGGSQAGSDDLDALYGLKSSCVFPGKTRSWARTRTRVWLAPGAHVNAVGSSIPTARELDTATMKQARLFVETWPGGCRVAQPALSAVLGPTQSSPVQLSSARRLGSRRAPR